MDKLHAAYRKQTVRHIPKESGRHTRDSASWLVSRASLILVSCCTIKTDVLAESVSCWLATGCTIAQASIHLLAFNVQAACTQSALVRTPEIPLHLTVLLECHLQAGPPLNDHMQCMKFNFKAHNYQADKH